MEENEDSVFYLITSLCEKFSNDTDKIKNLRSKCYEILLKKKIATEENYFKDLEGTTDPMVNLLSWNFTLVHEFNLKGVVDKINKSVESLKDCYKNNTNNFNTILQFLLNLRHIPSDENDKYDLSSLPQIEDKIEQFNNLFKLPESLLCESEEYWGKSFTLKPKSNKKGTKSVRIKNTESKVTCDSNFNDHFQDEGYNSPTKESIWEIASKLEYCDRKNWENFGLSEPDKEKPFLSELGDLSSLWVENLESLYYIKWFPSEKLLKSRLKPRKIFLRDVKYLLVGMPSDTFSLNEKYEFSLLPSVGVEGITPTTLERYCRELVFCGTSYKALKKMSTTDSETRKFKYPGYIFTEFCESISRYLQFYRTTVLSVPDSTNFLNFHEKTYQIRMQLTTLASICKAGSYDTESEDMPQGVALLNYLYQKVLSITDKNIMMVLYSALYSCCQVYFSRFLQQWILEGTINDPYGEFFIKPNGKYISTRGRTYWTRSYMICEDKVPDFLIDLRSDILFCGKMMNLLKLCFQTSKLCLYLMGKKPLIVTCCLTYEQLSLLRQNATSYYLEVCQEIGPDFSLSRVVAQFHEEDPLFMRLIAKKRAATLKRIELEKKKLMQQQKEKKLEELSMLKEQYEAALEQKQLKILREIQREIKEIEDHLAVEKMREKLIQEESNKMIDYYTKLSEIAESHKTKIEKNIQIMKNIHKESELEKYTENLIGSEKKSNTSNESFYSLSDDLTNEKIEQTTEKPENIKEKPTEMHSSQSLDILNANLDTKEAKNRNENAVKTETINTNIQQAIDNFELARKIKQKVMTQEMGIDMAYHPIKTANKTPQITNLTEAQRNKLKILHCEFGIDLHPHNLRTENVLTVAQVNRNKVMSTNECFNEGYKEKKLDNENFVNKNNQIVDNVNAKTGAIKKSKSLALDFDTLSVKSHRSDCEKPIPMSVDSTPISDLPHSAATTPSTMFLSVDTNHFESIPNTADTLQTDEGFAFENSSNTSVIPIYFNKSESKAVKPVFSKRVTPQEALAISKNCLKMFLHESISVPLVTQLKLANNEILKYFIEDSSYLKHLISLRDYFFLQDGEFGRNITNNLFEKLYNANDPMQLINCRTLKYLVFGALELSSKNQENSQYLSFKINSLPKSFDLCDPDVLDCLSLTYKVKWPLNILLPTDTVGKYDEVFKYLLKLNRISWILKKIFSDLKNLAREIGKKEIYLMSSPQYRNLHQYRHVMTHFIQTLQNYIVGEVLQPSWELFEKTLSNVTNLDELYSAHTAYIKHILFMCLLNQKTAILRNVIQKIFVVILKFYDYLRSRNWKCEEGTYIHPNFDKLESIFKNFKEFVFYLIKVVRKVARSGYQPHLLQLLDMLNVNGYYSQRNITN